MLKTLFTAAVFAIFGGIPSVMAGPTLNFAGGAETTRWALSGNIFECRFEQDIPNYGKAVFYHKAGEDVAFQLETDRNLMAYSQADVSITPPPWKPSGRSERLGSVTISGDEPSLKLDSKRSNRFIHALMEGRWPTINHKTFYDDGRYVQVQVSAVQFDKAYLDYILCVDQLLPINFDQIGRSKVYFKSSEEGLDKEDLVLLDKVIFYIKHDPRIFAIYLDGHTDNVGRRYDNRQISKRRVEAVERYLLTHGIDPEIITTRFHGGRYPVASNATAKGRAENRRVTIRLEQRDDMPIPDELVFKLPEDATVVPASSAYPVSAQR